MKPVSVLLVDDSPFFRRLAARFLEACDDVDLLGTADGGEGALAQAQALWPQVVLLDLAMPGMSGLEVIPLLRRILPQVGIVVLTMQDSDGYREAAFAAGADDFVPKSVMNTTLLPAIRRVAQAREIR
jgi:DNA-binding NarL/FixJ family response regulator